MEFLAGRMVSIRKGIGISLTNSNRGKVNSTLDFSAALR